MGTHEDACAAPTISWRAGWYFLWVIFKIYLFYKFIIIYNIILQIYSNL